VTADRLLQATRRQDLRPHRVELILETRGTAHTDRIVGKLEERGYEVVRQHTKGGE
jgi:hypothetical protein